MSHPLPPQRSMLSALLASQNNHESSSSYEPSSNKGPQTDHVKLDEISPSSNPQSPEESTRSSPSSVKDSNNAKYDRTTKVAKIKYSDHGSHAVVVDEASESPSHVPSSDDDDDNDDNEDNDYDHDNVDVHKKNSHQTRSSSNDPPPSLIPLKRTSPSVRSNKPTTSLLHAVLTKGVASADLPGGERKVQGPLHEEIPPCSECLTSPPDPISNDGCDNIEGNLIVFKNDLLKVPNRKISSHQHSDQGNFLLKNNDPLGVATFQVIRLLGQGTFAQVFECKHLDTGKVCAVKIVKNKPAYTRQAAVEIEVFKTMMQQNSTNDDDVVGGGGIRVEDGSEYQDMKDYMVSLLCHFMYKSHLCLVFELLGQNLYELLKRRQFRGLPIGIVKDIVKQALIGMKELVQRRIVHCDLKPENILLVTDEMMDKLVDSKPKSGTGKDPVVPAGKTNHYIKLIDFGSACFEDKTGFTYIQSRFYRSPEVLVGIHYDSAIDMWSLGCVAAELFLGLPILPGVHELDQLGRIQEMIGDIPEWMLDQGKKTMKYYSLRNDKMDNGNDKVAWKLKSRREFIESLSKDELERFGGKAKLEQPPTNRYFKFKNLRDIILHHGNRGNHEERENLILFVHLLRGLLNPDPCERFTAYQASSHPFFTGNKAQLRRKLSDGILKSENDFSWSPPWDPSICRRKLSLKQGSMNRLNQRRNSPQKAGGEQLEYRPKVLASPNTLCMMNMTGAMSLSNLDTRQSLQSSPPVDLGERSATRVRRGSSRKYPEAISAGHISTRDTQHPYLQHGNDLSVSLHRHFDSLPPPPTLYSHNVHQMQQQPQVYPMMAGPQSFSGFYHTGGMGVVPQGDLGYALQRPGVVPGTSVGAIQHINNSIQLHQQQQLHQQVSMGNSMHGASYVDMGSLPSSYNMGLSSMSMSSIHNGSVPQDYILSDVRATYQMPYGNDQAQAEYYQQTTRGDQQIFYSYRGSSM